MRYVHCSLLFVPKFQKRLVLLCNKSLQNLSGVLTGVQNMGGGGGVKSIHGGGA